MICAIIQARMSSARLPGKVLLPINGRPMLSYMIERVKQARRIDKVVLATSSDRSDDGIAEFCREERVLCYRGNLDDVLDRYYQAAKLSEGDVIVRLTGDCPLIDPQMIDAVVGFFVNGQYDYVGNSTPPNATVPDGMDVEVFSFAKLEQAWQEAQKPSDREHVTFYFWKNPQLFKVGRYDLPENLARYRLTVDYPEDFALVRRIFTELYPRNAGFGLPDIVQFLAGNPSLQQMNNAIKPNQGWQSAFDKDKKAGFTN